MDCLKQLGWSEQELQTRLSQYLDGELTGAYADDLEEHLKECTTCRTLLSELRGTDRNVAHAVETAKASEGFVKRVMTALSGRRSSMRTSGKHVPRHLILIIGGVAIVGALALVAVLVGSGSGGKTHTPTPTGLSLYAPFPETRWEVRAPGSRSWHAEQNDAEVRTGTGIRLAADGLPGRILRPDGLTVYVAPGTTLQVSTDATAAFGLELASGRMLLVATDAADRISLSAGPSCEVTMAVGSRTAYVDYSEDRAFIALLSGGASLAGPWGVRELASGESGATVAGGPLDVQRHHDSRVLPLEFAPVPLRVSAWPQLGGSACRSNHTPFTMRAPTGAALRLEGVSAPSAPVIGLDGSVFILAGPKPGRLIRVVSRDNTTSFLLDGPHVGGPVVTGSGLVLVALRTGVYSLDPRSAKGELVKIVDCVSPSTPTHPLTLAPDGRFYVTYNRGLSAHSLSGESHWRRDDLVAGAPPSVGLDGTVYIASTDGRLVALDPETGATRPSDATPVDEAMVTRPVVAPDGTAYALSATRYLVWRSPDGSHGRASLPEASYTRPPAIALDGSVTVVSSAGVVHRLTAKPHASAEASFFEAGEAITRGPVVDRTGHIALWTASGKLLLVSKEGRPVAHDIGARQPSAPAVARGGMLIFTTRDGRVFGIEPASR